MRCFFFERAEREDVKETVPNFPSHSTIARILEPDIGQQSHLFIVLPNLKIQEQGLTVTKMPTWCNACISLPNTSPEVEEDSPLPPDFTRWLSLVEPNLLAEPREPGRIFSLLVHHMYKGVVH